MRWDFSNAALEPMPRSRCVCRSRNAKVVRDPDGCSENRPAHVENNIVYESQFWHRYLRQYTDRISLAELGSQ